MAAWDPARCSSKFRLEEGCAFVGDEAYSGYRTVMADCVLPESGVVSWELVLCNDHADLTWGLCIDTLDVDWTGCSGEEGVMYASMPPRVAWVEDVAQNVALSHHGLANYGEHFKNGSVLRVEVCMDTEEIHFFANDELDVGPLSFAPLAAHALRAYVDLCYTIDWRGCVELRNYQVKARRVVTCVASGGGDELSIRCLGLAGDALMPAVSLAEGEGIRQLRFAVATALDSDVRCLSLINASAELLEDDTPLAAVQVAQSA